jgi:hypothetical protein
MYFPGNTHSEDFSKLNIKNQAFFIHEMTHVWQYQKTGKHLGLQRNPLAGLSRSYYDYGPLEKITNFDDLNIEQQASLIADYYKAMKKGTAEGHTLAEISSIIPDEIKRVLETDSDTIGDDKSQMPSSNPAPQADNPLNLLDPGLGQQGSVWRTPGIISSRNNKFSLPSILGNKNTSRTSNLSLESLLGAEISRSADGIVDRIIGRNPNMFQASAGRFLSQSVERFGQALIKGRIDSFEDAFTSVLGGKNGALGFASDIGNQVVGGLLQSGLGKLFGGTKTSTTSYESARSIAAGNAFGMSRGQQAAEMLTQLQKGQRNL